MAVIGVLVITGEHVMCVHVWLYATGLKPSLEVVFVVRSRVRKKC